MKKYPAVFRDIFWYRQNVPCMEACPVHTDSGRYVQLIAEKRYEEAFFVARSPNPLASVCGRICSAPCEDACRRGSIDEPIAIRPLKRFLTE
jgi:NADPH-dependent glutamate synthase beta subunit-like oxidoreductase